MYESFYGLSRRPFSATADPDCCAAMETMQRAFDELFHAVEGGQEIGILTAPAGAGKTLLCRKLAAELGETFTTVLLANANFPTRRSLLQAILYELEHPYIRMAEQELRLEFDAAVREICQHKQALVLIVDEAHLLSEHLLEEVRTLTNLSDAGAPLVRVILSGQLSLEEKLAGPAMDALNQKVGVQTTLDTLARQESADFIAYRLNWADGQLADIFTPEALKVICEASDGLPRCLNQLCDHSLLLGYVAEEQPVSETTVRDALDDLKQLPLHWNEPTAPAEPIEQLTQQLDLHRARNAETCDSPNEPADDRLLTVDTPSNEPSFIPNNMPPSEETQSNTDDSAVCIEAACIEVGAVEDKAVEVGAVEDEDIETGAIEFGAGEDDAHLNTAEAASFEIGETEQSNTIEIGQADPESLDRTVEEPPQVERICSETEPHTEAYELTEEELSIPDGDGWSPPETLSQPIPMPRLLGLGSKHQRPSIAADHAEETTGTAEETTGTVEAGNDVEEEVIVDRYAKLDSQRQHPASLPPSPQSEEHTLNAGEHNAAGIPIEPLIEAFEAADRHPVAHTPQPRPEQIIDQVEPVLQEVFDSPHPKSGTTSTGRPDAALQPSPPVPIDPAAELQEADPIERAIGSVVLDVCLDAQKSLEIHLGAVDNGASQPVRTFGQPHRIEPPRGIEPNRQIPTPYDVVLPETEEDPQCELSAKDTQTDDHTVPFSASGHRDEEPTVSRHKQLFSKLRRRQA